METTLWFRNPDQYIRELVDSGAHRFVWKRDVLVKKEIDPNQWASLYLGVLPWESLVLGNEAVHIDMDHDIKNPKAVYPIWAYGDEMDVLEDLAANPVGEDMRMCADLSVSIDERPIFGQDHIIVITDTPPANSGPGRRFLKQLKEINEDYPKTIFHLHGTYSFRASFGMGFGSADIDALGATKQNKVTIPPGSELAVNALVANPQWARVLGFNPVDLNIPRNRTIFNIKSAEWAAKYWDSEIAPKTARVGEIDHRTPEAAYYAPTIGGHTITARKGAPGDKVICNECSLAIDCKFYRADSVCTVPKTEVSKLAAYFGTRDSYDIIDGLTAIVKRGAERLDTALETESVIGDTDPSVTKQMSVVFDQGIKLAKLIDPKLRGGPSVQVNVGSGGTAAVQVGDTRQIVASAMRELEASGVKREEITSAMIEAVITRGMTGDKREPERVPIEGHVVRPSHPDLSLVPEPVSRPESS
jgi:hypothetical protein